MQKGGKMVVSLLVLMALNAQAAPRQGAKPEGAGYGAVTSSAVVSDAEEAAEDLAAIYREARRLESEYRRSKDVSKLARAAGMYAFVANERREVLIDYQRAAEELFAVNADLASEVVRTAWRSSDKSDDFKPMVEKVLARLTKDVRGLGLEDATKRVPSGTPLTGDCKVMVQKVLGISELSNELGDFNTWKARRLQYADLLGWCNVDQMAGKRLADAWDIYNEFGEGENARKVAELLGTHTLSRFQSSTTQVASTSLAVGNKESKTTAWSIADLKEAYDWFKRAQYDGKKISERIVPLGSKAEEAEQYAAAFAIYSLLRDETNRKRMELLVSETDQKAILALLADDRPAN